MCSTRCCWCWVSSSTDLCQVVFWYGDPDAGRPQLLQFQGADPAVLPDALAGFFVRLYASYEETLVDGSATIAGRTVRTLTDTGSPGQVFYIYPLGDALLLTDDQDLLAFVLPGLPPTRRAHPAGQRAAHTRPVAAGEPVQLTRWGPRHGPSRFRWYSRPRPAGGPRQRDRPASH